ncbi:MAG: hypothetical protein PHQ40_15295 [Anaerolineaceae bacterium]|nr:hypothetical protein [Anaerolineaceae bacterium]
MQISEAPSAAQPEHRKVAMHERAMPDFERIFSAHLDAIQLVALVSPT